MKNIKKLFLVMVFGLGTTLAIAQTDDTNPQQPKKTNLSVGAGFAFIPEYEGSEDYMVVPFPLFSLDWNSGQYIRLVGLDMEANLLRKKNHKNWEFGPKLSFKPGRDNEIDNIDVANLEEIDFSISAGLFAQYKFAKGFDIRGEYTHDISGVSEGGVADFELGYTCIKNNRLITRIAATTSFATENYMNTYFGVNPDNMGTSLLPFYNVESGFKDVGLKLNATYLLNSKWILAGQIGAVELIGDVADSPIVTTGTSTQFAGGVSVMYRF